MWDKNRTPKTSLRLSSNSDILTSREGRSVGQNDYWHIQLGRGTLQRDYTSLSIRGIPGCSSGADWDAPMTQPRTSRKKTELRGSSPHLILENYSCTYYNFPSRCSVHINLSVHFLFHCQPCSCRPTKRADLIFNPVWDLSPFIKWLVLAALMLTATFCFPECWERQFLCLVHQWEAGASPPVYCRLAKETQKLTRRMTDLLTI